MTQSDSPQRRYGSERLCPHCGTRVAQKARTCFFCGGSLEKAPRRRLSVRWADVVLFTVIGGLLLFWWVRRPSLPGPEVSPTNGAAEAVAEGTAGPDLLVESVELSPTVEPLPTSTAMPELTPGSDLTLTPNPSPSATATAGPIRHTVKSGDTVLSLAGTYGSTVKDIIAANGLSANGFLRVGQELVIPVTGSDGGATPTATAQGGALVYTVQPGDTISLIAARYGSTVEWILKANNMQPTEIIHAGRALTIPLSNITPTPEPTAVESPTVTPTPGLPFNAPALLAPADDALISRELETLLSWTSVGTLTKEQWYVVTLQTPGSPSAIAPFWTKGTSWRVPPDLIPASDSPVRAFWYVRVLTGSPGNPGEPASPPSTSRRFTWE
jgi:LysM repeat protein